MAQRLLNLTRAESVQIQQSKIILIILKSEEDKCYADTM